MHSRWTKLLAAVLILAFLVAPAAWAAPRAENGHGWTGLWAQVWTWVRVLGLKAGATIPPVGAGGDSLNEGGEFHPDG